MAVLLGGLLAFSAGLPPEHGHADSRGRVTVVHRHPSMHAVRTTWPAALCATEPLVIRTDSGYLAAAAASLHRADALVTGRPVPDVPEVRFAPEGAAEIAGSIHGPPSSPFLPRPPPASTVL